MLHTPNHPADDFPGINPTSLARMRAQNQFQTGAGYRALYCQNYAGGYGRL